MWKTQTWKFMNSKKANIYLCLPDFIATKIVMWKCHVDKSTNGRYNIILGRDLLTALEIYIKCYENFIIGDKQPYEGCLALMVDISNYDFTFITDKMVKREESFINSNVEKCMESESAIRSTRRVQRILDAKY